MNENRPINLDVTKYRFPAPAIASILHRISGLLIFLLIPFLLWMFDKSLRSPVHYSQLQNALEFDSVRWIVWFLLSSLVYHFIAGIRHLLMDVGIGESKIAGRLTAYLAMVISGIFIVWMGWWLW